MNQQPGDRRPRHGKVKQIRQDYAGLVLTLVILIVLTAIIVTCAALRVHRSKVTPDVPSADRNSLSDGETPGDDEDSEKKQPVKEMKYLTMSESDLQTGDLILVNRDHHYDPAAATGSVTNVRDGRITNIQENSFQLPIGEKILATLEDMQTGMAADMKDGMRLLVNAGYRTADAQQAIIDSYTESRGEEYVQQYVAPVGASEHHTVYAADISFYDTTAGKVLATTAVDAAAYYSWCLMNCKNYGLILRYTADKVDITGYSAESWHFRYVGIPHASYIYDHSLALEEYLEQLKVTTYNNRLYVTAEDGRCWSIYYTAASEGGSTQVPVPQQQSYTLSGNNADGFIVTVEEPDGAPEGAMVELVSETSSSAASSAME